MTAINVLVLARAAGQTQAFPSPFASSAEDASSGWGDHPIATARVPLLCLEMPLRSLKQRFEAKFGGSDGEIGRMKDVYFGNQSRVVRNWIVGTSCWLGGQRILISPCAFASLDPLGNFPVLNFTRKQIENRPLRPLSETDTPN